MSRYQWCLFLISVFGAVPNVLAEDSSPPNLMVILADDLGYSDLGCYGGEIETPNLDRLAANGLRFTQFYNTARCWPTRAGIMTGYYAQQVRRDQLPKIPSAGGSGRRPDWARLVTETLKPQGYRTYHSGKWHIDGAPLQNGFDHSYLLNDQDRFFSPRFHAEDDKPLPAVEPNSGFYATTAIADHSIKCLKDHAQNHAGKPFFQYLCFTSPHFPLHALPQDIAKYHQKYMVGWDAIRARRFAKQREMGLLTCELCPRQENTAPKWNLPEKDLVDRIGAGEAGRAVAWNDLTDEQRSFQAGKMAIHAAMIDRMDREIGRVLDQLKAMNAIDNTLILFLSDNGASGEQIIRGDGHDKAAPAGSANSYLCLGPGWSTAANTPFRMHKSWAHEGGISTPFVVHWPRGIAEKGGLRHAAAHVIDIAPTLMAVAHAKRFETWNNEPVPAAPGFNLLPAFAANVNVPHEFFWWYHSDNRAVRVGDWKLVQWGDDHPWELFDLKADRSETNNLAEKHPEKVKQLEATWKAKLEEFQDLASRDLPKKENP